MNDACPACGYRPELAAPSCARCGASLDGDAGRTVTAAPSGGTAPAGGAEPTDDRTVFRGGLLSGAAPSPAPAPEPQSPAVSPAGRSARGPAPANLFVRLWRWVIAGEALRRPPGSAPSR